MKQVFALAAYVLLAALCGAGAQDLNQLELGTHDLAEIKTLTGVTLVFDPTRIVMVFVLSRTLGSTAGRGKAMRMSPLRRMRLCPGRSPEEDVS